MLVHDWDLPPPTVRWFARAILSAPPQAMLRVCHTSLDERVDTAVVVAAYKVEPDGADLYAALVAIRDAAQAEIVRLRTVERRL